MKTFLATCLLCFSVASAEAYPTVYMSWDGGPQGHPNWNRTRAEGAVATVVVTATGITEPIRGVDVRIKVGSQYRGMPDAWRFEPGGCAEGGLQLPEVAIDSSCPFLKGTNAQRFSKVVYNSGEWFYYAIGYDAVVTSPGTRYTIAQFQFDLSKAFEGLGLKADSCGCIEQPQGIAILYATYVTADGQEIPFTIGTSCLNWEDPANSVSCPFFGCDLCGPGEPPPPVNPCSGQVPTTATPRTWGSVKAGYR